MKWALVYLLLLLWLPACLGAPLPGISAAWLSLSDKRQGPDRDHESLNPWEKSWKGFGSPGASTGRLSPSSQDTHGGDGDITKTSQRDYQHQRQRPITLSQPLAYTPHHDSEYTASSSTSNSHQNNNNHNININNSNSHGTFLTNNSTPTPTAPPHQLQPLPPSTTKRYLRVLHETQLPTTFLKNHMHEIVVAGLFLLVPITLALVEIIERIGLGVDENVELQHYLERRRGRGMIRRGRGKVLRKKRGKRKSQLIQMEVEVDIEDQVFSR
ncbi:hypothetical protein ABOM_003268 [Aspergillus bombycis]|uniref:Uncharacterized protein n=1 Tax=Aspergillus bombycis TaxID=109264 RepID=A0A1F8A7W4_9EURO|nr:hypothetical protein ABOM_003268 [Aspergillus bombycis]OGM47781.1 hypothetical protein ABOM_003268 [Aspergillus bombycis]